MAVEPGEVFREYERSGAIAALADAIEAGTGSPAAQAGEAGLLSALAAAFPDLPAPDALEGCTSHPALTMRSKIPGLGREAVKLVFVPRSETLEVRVRIEVPGGSYRKETLIRMAEHAHAVERSLEGRRSRP